MKPITVEYLKTKAELLAEELDENGFDNEDLEPGYVAWLLRHLAKNLPFKP